MVIRISTEQLNVNDIMNNEPPLILISKQLLIVYKATASRERMRREGRKGNWERKEREIKQGRKRGRNEGRTNTIGVISLLNCDSWIRTHDGHLNPSPKSNRPASIYCLTFCTDPGAGCRALQLLGEHKTSLIS